ncbi:MAG: hypothetical protein EXS36_14795 [Pedosphaera sp.]|nr:hypothetical protein [Pedosphaera sp.]
MTGASITSISPPVSRASPDAPIVIGIADLGNGATTLLLDNAAVTPSKGTFGNITTLTYQPPALLTPGSHTVNLSYAGKTLNYAFTVLNAIIIQASVAAQAGTVDTSKGGFTVRVHQTRESQNKTTGQRAEQQLAGLLGANIADLSSANANGTFGREVINFDEAGNSAGDITGDEAIPGIPGTEGGSDNIALEAIGYLDLKPGVYTLGGVTDDSLRLSLGRDPRDVTSVRRFLRSAAPPASWCSPTNNYFAYGTFPAAHPSIRRIRDSGSAVFF